MVGQNTLESSKNGFQRLNLDSRVLYAVQKLGFKEPTLIQEKAIPFALEGKDVLAKARTGSGKTAAYLIPIVQRLLTDGEEGDGKAFFALILVPTKELSVQVTEQVTALLKNCGERFSVVNLGSGELSLHQQSQLLELKPSVVVSTPFRILQHVTNGTVSFKESLKCVVCDEADLLFSYGYSSDVKSLLEYLPTHCQHFMMSATLPESVQNLKSLVLRNPVVLQLKESEDQGRLSQYLISLKSDFERFLVIYFLLKLKVHPFGTGRILIFVRDVERLYFLKLYLDSFGIKTAALNAELPITARYHIIQEFNRGIYDILLATDGSDDLADESSGDGTALVPKAKKRPRAHGTVDSEYDSSRGIDFQNVQSVINFDLPRKHIDYVHRIGRTARGVGNSGYALTLTVAPSPEAVETVGLEADQAKELEIVERLKAGQAKRQQEIKLYTLDMAKIDPFKYRCEDAFRAVTPRLIKDARIKEISKEMLLSEKLKSHFDAFPADYRMLRHDLPISSLNKSHGIAVSSRAHLKHVPDYLLPNTMSKRPKTDKSAETVAETTAMGTATGIRGDRKAVKAFRHSAPKTFGHLKWSKTDPLKSVKL